MAEPLIAAYDQLIENPRLFREWPDDRLLDHYIDLGRKVEATRGQTISTHLMSSMNHVYRLERVEILRRMTTSWKPNLEDQTRPKVTEAFLRAFMSVPLPGNNYQQWAEDMTDVLVAELGELKIFWALEQWVEFNKLGPLT